MTTGVVSTTATAAQADGTTIYVAGGQSPRQDGAVHAVSSSGEQTWVWTPPENESPFGPSRYIATPPTVVGGTVYVITSGGTCYGVDAASGETALEVDVPAISAPTVVDGTLYAAGGDTAFAVDLETEEIAWENTDAEWTGDPLVVDGAVYLFQETYSDPGVISCLDATNGEVQWEYEREGWEEFNGPAILDGTLYVGAHQGAFDPAGLHAIDVETGDGQWITEFGEGLGASTPVVYDGVVYLGDSVSVFAFDTADGEELWSIDVVEDLSDRQGRAYPPTVVDGQVYVTASLALVCLDAASGDELWRYDEGVNEDEMLADAATIHDGVAYVTTTETQNVRPEQATLHAVDVESGDALWTFDPDPADLIEANQYQMLDGVPTVVDDPAGGDSVDSRILQAIYGHTEATTGDDPVELLSGGTSEGGSDDTGGSGSDDDSDDTEQGNDSDGDDGSPGPGIGGAVAAVGGATYLLKRRLSGSSAEGGDRL